jgi:hypothetical protein
LSSTALPGRFPSFVLAVTDDAGGVISTCASAGDASARMARQSKARIEKRMGAPGSLLERD